VNVIRGGADIISLADLLVLEFWPYGIRRQNMNEGELIDFISSHFHYGQILSDKQDSGIINNIEEITKTLTKFSNSNPGTKHLDLILFKQNPDSV
jgi:hypothetical protein